MINAKETIRGGIMNNKEKSKGTKPIMIRGLDPALHHLARIEALKRGLTIGEYYNDLLRWAVGRSDISK